MRRSRLVASIVAGLLTLTAGYAALDAYDVVPGILTIAPPDHGSSSPSTPTTGPPGARRLVVPTALATASPLAGLSDTAPTPTEAGLAARLAGPLRNKALGPSVSVVVRDAATQRQLFGKGADTPRAPASTTKLLTAAASLHELLGPTATATTRVVQGSSKAAVVLVAGGDSLLAPGRGNPNAVSGRAGLGDLAAQAAARLRAGGVTKVSLGLDDHIANGPRYAPKWLAEDIAEGFTGPVAMLGLSTRRARDGHPAPSDPAMATAQAFATALRAHGITVGTAIHRTRTGASATVLGAVTSAPVVDVLSAALDASDNALTETVARRAAAKAGAGTSFADVAGFVTRTVRSLGVDTAGVHMVDSCGLSRGTGIPARVIADLLDDAADGQDPALQQVVAQLPVAGVSGTLRHRFALASTNGAAGLARAKTGTLTGVSALAGTVVDRDGRLLTFVTMVDKVPATTGSPGARAALDRIVATLAGCGCR